MNAEDNICYSPLSAVCDFTAPGSNSSSQMMISQDLLRAQMDMSRIIMFSEIDYANVEEPYIGYIRGTMSLISNIYDIFEKIETSRKKYIEAMQGLE